MTRTNQLIYAATLALAATGVHAGSAGAGPGGTGSAVVGASITPASVSGALFQTLEPGQVAAITLTPEQATALAEYLRQEGAAETAGVLTAAVTFQDETPGTVTLDTATGALTFARD